MKKTENDIIRWKEDLGGGGGGGVGNDGLGDFFSFSCVYICLIQKKKEEEKKKRHGLLKHISTVSLFFYVPAPYDHHTLYLRK